MKNITRKMLTIAGAAALVCAADVGEILAATATATVTGTVVAPIAIANASNFNFGTVVGGVAAGTVTVDTEGARTRSGGTTLVGGAGVAASFTVSGGANMTYSIGLPADFALTDGSGHTMAINGFTSSPTPTGTLSALGSQVVKVGATVNLEASQAPGTYTQTNASDFTVTVDYN